MTIGVLSEPAEYLKFVARPIFERFQAEPTAVELAVSTCIGIAHFADVLHIKKKQSLTQVRDDLVALCPSFRIVDAFCNAAKHVEIDKKRHGTLIGLRLDVAERSRAAAFSDGSYFSDGSSFAEHPKTIRILAPDGRRYDLLFEARKVLEALELAYLTPPP